MTAHMGMFEVKGTGSSGKPWCQKDGAISSRAPGLRLERFMRRAVCSNSSIHVCSRQ